MTADILPFPSPTPSVPANDRGAVTRERLVILTDARVPARPDLGAVDLYRDDGIALTCIVRGFREHEDEWTMRARLLCEHIESFNEGNDDVPA